MADDMDTMDTNVELYPIWRQALIAFRERGWTYGDQIPHDWFYEVFGLPLQADQDRMTFAQVKRIHLIRLSQFEPMRDALRKEHQMDLQSVAGFGYEVVHPRDQGMRAYEDTIHAIKKAVRDGLDRSVTVNQSLLTVDERRQNADILARIGLLRQLLRERPALPAPDEE